MSVTPHAPPGPLVLTGQADAIDSQLWFFTVTNAQGTTLTLLYGDGSEETVTAAPTLTFEHRYAGGGTFTVTARSQNTAQNDKTLGIVVVASPTVEPPAVTPGRPSVDQVAVLIRARTKDSNGNEVGTFDDETRPTADEVEEQIDAAYALVGCRFPDPGSKGFPDRMVPAFQELVAYRAALRIEKSYFPEQVRSDRSAYAQLREEYLDDLTAFTDTLEAGGGEAGYASQIVSLPVGSWTSIPYSWVRPPVAPDPELELWSVNGG